jgi:hypothetical protein
VLSLAAVRPALPGFRRGRRPQLQFGAEARKLQDFGQVVTLEERVWDARMMAIALNKLPARESETGRLNVVVDTPKGSRNKYKYDEKTQV